jgi:hypothetical protein
VEVEVVLEVIIPITHIQFNSPTVVKKEKLVTVKTSLRYLCLAVVEAVEQDIQTPLAVRVVALTTMVVMVLQTNLDLVEVLLRMEPQMVVVTVVILVKMVKTQQVLVTQVLQEQRLKV